MSLAVIDSDEGAYLKFDWPITMSQAMSAGLINPTEFAAWKRDSDAAYKARSEAAERETFERLRAKFGETL